MVSAPPHTLLSNHLLSKMPPPISSNRATIPHMVLESAHPFQVLMTRSQAQSLHPAPSPRFLGNMLVCGLGPDVCNLMTMGQNDELDISITPAL